MKGFSFKFLLFSKPVLFLLMVLGAQSCYSAEDRVFTILQSLHEHVELENIDLILNFLRERSVKKVLVECCSNGNMKTIIQVIDLLGEKGLKVAFDLEGLKKKFAFFRFNISLEPNFLVNILPPVWGSGRSIEVDPTKKDALQDPYGKLGRPIVQPKNRFPSPEPRAWSAARRPRDPKSDGQTRSGAQPRSGTRSVSRSR